MKSPWILPLPAAVLMFLWLLAGGLPLWAQDEIPDGAGAWVPISAVQGDGPATRLGGRVSTVGRVTGITTDGFFVQAAPGDGSPETSEGLFVYLGYPARLTVGHCVRVVDGLAQEFYEKTELARPGRVEPSRACGASPIDPHPLALTGALGTALEPLEGMLVAVAPFRAVVQGPTRGYGGGEREMALQPIAGSGAVSPGEGRRVFAGDLAQGSPLTYVSSRIGGEIPDVAWGDVISTTVPLLAIVDYNFGKYQLLPLPGQTPAVTPGRRDPVQVVADDPAGFSVCTFNVNGLGQGTEQIRTAAAYARAVRRTAETIAHRMHGCTVIGLQETGTPADVVHLARVLTEELRLPYRATAFAGPNSSSRQFPLTNGLLTRSDRVGVVRAALAQGCAPLDFQIPGGTEGCEGGRFALFNRPPLVAELQVSGPWAEPYSLVVINNHWKSKRGGNAGLLQRLLQARHVGELVQRYLDRDPEAHVVVLGDLNDDPESGPLQALVQTTRPRLVHGLDAVPSGQRYTYIFNGVSQALDHILMAPGMVPEFGGLMPLHINADLPEARAEDGDEWSAGRYQTSDHDPLFMWIRPDGAGWIGGRVADPAAGVRLLDDKGQVVGAASPDATGEYRLWNIPPGAYRLAYGSASGRLAWREFSVTVEAGVGLTVAPLAADAAGTRLGKGWFKGAEE